MGDGDHGYDTSFGPALAYSNLWVNQWLRTFAEPVAAFPTPSHHPNPNPTPSPNPNPNPNPSPNPNQVAAQGEPPLLLTRGVWAGGQRHGVVLWSRYREI